MSRFAVVTCSDGKMLPAACCALLSIYNNEETKSLELILVGIDLAESEVKLAHAFFSDQHITLNVIPFSLPVHYAARSGKWSSATWARLHLDELLPRDIERLLYVDADTLAVASLAGLFDTNLHDLALGAVDDIVMANPHKMMIRKQLIGMGKQNPYFNAGILLFDWQKTLNENHLQTARKIYETGIVFQAPDQDALNASFNGNWFRLHPRFNVQSGILPFGARKTILHFTGGGKPWKSNRAWDKVFAAPLYRSMLVNTCWSGFCEVSTKRQRLSSWVRYHIRHLRRFIHYQQLKNYFATLAFSIP